MMQNVSTTPLHRGFGVQVSGVDLARLSATTFGVIQELYNEHCLLLFKKQSLAPNHQVALGRFFGVSSIPPRRQFNLGEHPEISLLGNVLNEDGSPKSFFNEMGVEWHSDSAGYQNLDGVTFLYALKVPPSGGETMFCSMHTAWHSLAPETQADLKGRRVLHSWNHHNDKVMKLSKGRPLSPTERALRPDYWTDLVQRHPVSGRTLYYISHNLVKQVDNLSESESLDFVMPLVEHATKPDRVYVQRWEPGDLVLWDNRSLMHSATDVSTYRAHERLLWRSYSFTGEGALPDGKLGAKHF